MGKIQTMTSVATARSEFVHVTVWYSGRMLCNFRCAKYPYSPPSQICWTVIILPYAQQASIGFTFFCVNSLHESKPAPDCGPLW